MKELFIKNLVCIIIFVVTVSYGQQKQKVIIDTDIAGDIDDVYALALILQSEEFEVLGVTLVDNDQELRVKVAGKLLQITGNSDIPVLIGNSIRKDEGITKYRQQVLWAQNFDKTKRIEQRADDFIIEQLNKDPGEIIIFTVGPVSNMADVIRKDPNALRKTKAIYSMLGAFYRQSFAKFVPKAEYNVRVDVASSQLFLKSNAEMIIAPLDITLDARLETQYFNQIKNHNSVLSKALYELTNLWGKTKTATLHDVVAVGSFIWPELFYFRKAHVKILESSFSVIDESKEPNCRLVIAFLSENHKNEFLQKVIDRLISFKKEENCE